MQQRSKRPPASPTAIGMQTGMDVPGLLGDVRGTLEEALVVPPTAGRSEADLDLVPGQSGAEALAALPDDQS
ncbi:MAG TPA: hypothetical protein VD969_06935 [Symbiobacteriaceae bacterium]|nr:hypothetical protein [Symbiobacteriaceae bacterium]